jgi:hypothetical protein
MDGVNVVVSLIAVNLNFVESVVCGDFRFPPFSFRRWIREAPLCRNGVGVVSKFGFNFEFESSQGTRTGFLGLPLDTFQSDTR